MPQHIDNATTNTLAMTTYEPVVGVWTLDVNNQSLGAGKYCIIAIFVK